MSAHLSLGHAYLCVRDIDANGAPVVGPAWTVRGEFGDWFSVRREIDDTLLAAWRANASAARALFALFGPQPFLDAIAAIEPACMPMREAWARRGELAVRTWLRRWPIWRFDGFVRAPVIGGDPLAGAAVAVSGEVRRLIYEGQQVPDPTVTAFPWRFAPDGTLVATDAAAIVRVNTIVRPALNVTLAGYVCHVVAEDEPQRS